MNTRIKHLRTFLNISQAQFGKQLGLKQSTICDIENGRCNITERVILSICARFNANEIWLKTGKGNMFNDFSTNENEFLHIFKRLSPDLQNFIINCGKQLLDIQEKI